MVNIRTATPFPVHCIYSYGDKQETIEDAPRNAENTFPPFSSAGGRGETIAEERARARARNNACNSFVIEIRPPLLIPRSRWLIQKNRGSCLGTGVSLDAVRSIVTFAPFASGNADRIAITGEQRSGEFATRSSEQARSLLASREMARERERGRMTALYKRFTSAMMQLVGGGS